MSQSRSTHQLLSHEFNKADVQLKKQIGSGIGGYVHLGTLNGEVIAVKEFINDAEAVDEIVIEINTHYALSNLKLSQHYLIRAKGYAQILDQFYLLMEYADGGSLYDYIPTVKIPSESKFNYIVQITSAVNWLHAHHFVHRDIKSMNILFHERRLKLCDFGSATKINNPHPKVSFGTPPWIAPEVKPDVAFTTAADVFSMAMVMWEVISQAKPFEECSYYEMRSVVADGKRPSIPVDCPANISQLISFGWAQEPKARPTAKQMFLALNGGSDDVSPVVAPSLKALTEVVDYGCACKIS